MFSLLPQPDLFSPGMDPQTSRLLRSYALISAGLGSITGGADALAPSIQNALEFLQRQGAYDVQRRQSDRRLRLAESDQASRNQYYQGVAASRKAKAEQDAQEKERLMQAGAGLVSEAEQSFGKSSPTAKLVRNSVAIGDLKRAESALAAGYEKQGKSADRRRGADAIRQVYGDQVANLFESGAINTVPSGVSTATGGKPPSFTPEQNLEILRRQAKKDAQQQAGQLAGSYDPMLQDLPGEVNGVRVVPRKTPEQIAQELLAKQSETGMAAQALAASRAGTVAGGAAVQPPAVPQLPEGVTTDMVVTSIKTDGGPATVELLVQLGIDRASATAIVQAFGGP